MPTFPKKVRRAFKKKAKTMAKRSKVTPAVKSYVNRVVHSNIEKKCQNNNINQAIGSGSASDLLFALTPESATGYQIVQGTGQGDRVGNHIRAVKSTLDFVLTPVLPDPDNNNEAQVHDVLMFIFRGKPDLKTTEAVDDLVLNNLWQSGDSSVGIFGDLRDLVYQPNMDRLSYFKRYHYKVGPSTLGDENNVPIAGGFNANVAGNNDYKLNVIKSINTLPSLIKKMDFNDNSDTTSSPTTWCMIYAVNANGSMMGDDQVPVSIVINAQLTYEDA